MIPWRQVAAALAMVTAVSDTAVSQPTATSRVLIGDSTRFLERARSGTSRFQAQQRAIDEGFTRVGVEFPAMGEHWVSFARLLEDKFVPDHPSVLIYVNTTRGPQLAGVAYSRLVTGRSAPPAFPYAGAWHEHNGAVNEESLPINHTAHAMTGGAIADGAPRLFVLHAWIWTPNPDGTFATDNWALPLRRLQRATAQPAKPPVSRDVAMAIALADDEAEYYRLVLSTSLGLSDAEDARVTRLLEDYRTRARQQVEEIRDGRQPSAALADRLTTLWSALWRALDVTLPARTEALRQLRALM